MTSDKNNVYKITISKISEMILFQVESIDIPKKLIKKGFSPEEMRNNFPFFHKDDYQNIESIYEQLILLIKNLSCELKEDDEKIELIIHTIHFKDKTINILFQQKIDVDITLSELTSLYKKLIQEKDNEIKNLNKKINESEKGYYDLKKEINELKNEIRNLKEDNKKEINELKKEIKNLKEENKKEIKELKNEFNKKINKINEDKENSDDKMDNLENDISNNSDRINELNNKLDKFIFNTKSNFTFLAYNDSKTFKNIFNLYYNKLKEKSSSKLFEDYFKESYDNTIDLIFDNITGKNGNNPNKVIEYKSKDYKEYKNYDAQNWNWFLISNVIFQMMFSKDIELSVNGVEQTLKKIYRLKPEFEKNFNSKLERAKYDIKKYIKGYAICEIIKGIIPKTKLLSNLENYLLA